MNRLKKALIVVVLLIAGIVAITVPLVSAPECGRILCVMGRHQSLSRYFFGFGGESSGNFTYYQFYW